jgi:predicted DNA-binding antitoxin AbrB/MazE fold protein
VLYLKSRNNFYIIEIEFALSDIFIRVFLTRYEKGVLSCLKKGMVSFSQGRKEVVRLRQLLVLKRLERRLNQYQVSQLLGITQSAFCQLEQGKRNITIEEALKFKEIYGLEWEDFNEVFAKTNV